MKLYDGGRAPNPRRVRIFLTEKGIKIPAEQIDLGALQQRSEAYTAINPMQRVPALVLDDGTVIAESIAICRYFEAIQPNPPLFGVGALQCALVEMWNRRAELHLLFPVASVFQHLHPAMSRMVDPQVPQWGEANKPRVMQFLEFLDRELKDRAHIAGADYTVADITALVAVEFMRVSKMAVPDGLSNLQRWQRCAGPNATGKFAHRAPSDLQSLGTTPAVRLGSTSLLCGAGKMTRRRKHAACVLQNPRRNPAVTKVTGQRSTRGPSNACASFPFACFGRA